MIFLRRGPMGLLYMRRRVLLLRGLMGARVHASCLAPLPLPLLPLPRSLSELTQP